MIQYQLQNRKLFNVYHGDYGLHIQSQNCWMETSRNIETYDVVKTIHFQFMKIVTPKGEMKIPVDPATTVKSVVETLTSTVTRVSQTASSPTQTQTQTQTQTSPPALVYALHLPTGDRIKDTDLAWNVLKDLSQHDRLKYRPVSNRCLLQTSTVSQPVEVEVDFSEPLESLKNFFCRRMGIRYRDFVSLVSGATGKVLDMQMSLYDQGEAPLCKLILNWQAIPFEPDNLLASLSGISLWDEPANADTIQFETVEAGAQRIVSATLGKLVEKLTEDQGNGTTDYLDFVKTFLLTYQSFTTAEILLRKLEDRQSWQEFEKHRATIQLRVCNVMLQWCKKYTWDFVHPEQGQRICTASLAFVDGVIAFEHASMAKQIRKNIWKLRDGQPAVTTKQMIQSWKSAVAVRTDYNETIFSHTAEDIAQQFTMIEEYLFSAIMPSELLGQAWTKKDAARRAPGIIALTRRFNAIAGWVGWAILEGKTPRLRAERLVKLVDVAQHLHTMSNFSTLMAIIAGINKAAISRLKQTFKELPSKTAKKLSDLEKLMSAEGSYKNYRLSIHAATPPCIPYIGKHSYLSRIIGP
eukprot:jgi/Hompol1/1668/HPOL_002322-RA